MPRGTYARFEEGIKGSGKFAACAVLADDRDGITPDGIKDVGIIRTVMGGKAVYES